MKKSILLSFTAIAALFISACGNNQPAQEENHDGHDHSKTEATSTIQLNDDKLNAVYQEYIKLNTALINSDAEAAKIAANTLELGAKELENGSASVASAIKITEAESIKDAREAFSELSNEMIALVKESGLKSGELYVDYCPMALNDTGGYWLSNEKGIRNPYFGKSMMTCGETKETI